MAAFTYLLFMRGTSDTDGRSVAGVLVIVGVLLSLAGAALWLWAFATIPGLSSGHYVLPDQALVTRGPYAKVRHPIYLAAIMLWFAVAAAYSSLSMLVVALLYVVPVYALYAQAEEKMMLEHFGSAYRDYQHQTGMLFPRLHGGRPTSR